MPTLKAHEVERFLDGLSARTVPPVLLAYGPDRGLVAECGERFAQAIGIDPSDAMAITVLDSSALSGDPGLLADEMNGPGLFGGTRLVRLRDAGNDRRLVAAVGSVLSDPPPGAHLAMEGGDLKRGSALLKLFERTPAGVALPCYADDDAAVRRTVERMVRDAGIAIADDAVDALVLSLGADRLASRAEIEKLLLYAHGTDRITLEDVRAATGDAGAVAADDAVDGALCGDGPRFQRAYARLLASKGSPFLVLRDLSQQLQWLERAQDGGGGASAAAKRLRAPGVRVHFKRIPALERAAARLTPERTRFLIAQTADTILASRVRGELEAEIVERLCFEIATDPR